MIDELNKQIYELQIELKESKIEIERLKTADIHISGVPSKVYKKLSKASLNDKMKEQLAQNERNFREEVMKMHAEWELENQKLKEEIVCLRQRHVDCDEGERKRLELRIEYLTKVCEDTKTALDHKREECRDFSTLVKDQVEQIHDLQEQC